MARISKNKSKQREALLDRAAALEQLIVQLDAARRTAAAAYHDSELAGRSIGNARAAAAAALKSLARGHYDRSERLLNVTWFYAKFAQDILNAEATEHILGNDRFLDLIEPASKIQAELLALIESADHMLDDLSVLIPPAWQWDAGAPRGRFD